MQRGHFEFCVFCYIMIYFQKNYWYILLGPEFSLCHCCSNTNNNKLTDKFYKKNTVELVGLLQV